MLWVAADIGLCKHLGTTVTSNKNYKASVMLTNKKKPFKALNIKGFF